MNEPYASAVGTTVLQLKEIPSRPADFNGALAIFGPKAGLNESQIRSTLEEKVGQVVSIEPTPLMPQKWVVRFESHKLALKAKEQCSHMAELWAGLDTLYNERAYDDRGWCKLQRSRVAAQRPAGGVRRCVRVIATLCAVLARAPTLPPHLAHTRAQAASRTLRASSWFSA
jgi:hypothetical protein